MEMLKKINNFFKKGRFFYKDLINNENIEIAHIDLTIRELVKKKVPKNKRDIVIKKVCELIDSEKYTISEMINLIIGNGKQNTIPKEIEKSINDAIYKKIDAGAMVENYCFEQIISKNTYFSPPIVEKVSEIIEKQIEESNYHANLPTALFNYCIHSEKLWKKVIDKSHAILQNDYQYFKELYQFILRYDVYTNQISSESDRVIIEKNYQLIKGELENCVNNEKSLDKVIFSYYTRIKDLPKFEIIKETVINKISSALFENNITGFYDLTRIIESDDFPKEVRERAEKQAITIIENIDNIEKMNNTVKNINRSDMTKPILNTIYRKIENLLQTSFELTSIKYTISNLCIEYNFPQHVINSLVNRYQDIVKNENSAKKLLSSLETRSSINNDNILDQIIHERIIQIVKNKFGQGINIPVEMFELVQYYKNTVEDFLASYDKTQLLLKKTNIPTDKFYQYATGSSYDWAKDINSVINIDEVAMLYEYFNKKENKEEKTKINKVNIDNILYALENYCRYPELCQSLLSLGRPLTEEEEKQISYLFYKNTTLNGNERPLKVEDLSNIKEVFKKIFEQKMSNTENLDINSLKELICESMFNRSINETTFLLNIYGNTEDFKILKFNDRSFGEIGLLAEEISVYISMMESVIDCNDEKLLKDMIKRILDNVQLSSSIAMKFSGIEEKIRKLYELDSQRMLSKNPSNREQYEKVLNKERTEKYNIDVLDYSDKAYILLAHCISVTENIENLAHGIENNNNYNFISLSAISYRNQKYYSQINNMILGYDNIPNGSFICSSCDNMGSNTHIREKSVEVSSIRRTQRGILEISDTETSNSEILCYREGIIPKYIILLGGREPTELELETAQKYGLKFVITQDIETRIDNPKQLTDDEYVNQRVAAEIENHYEEYQKLFAPLKEHKERKIAIFTDSHALYEPTLAILEDMKKRGITEIYSLGDNIGTGPNPSEVIDLLEENNVVSIKGNHELYLIEGLDKFQEHLEKTGAVESTIINREWTLGKLSEGQISKIKCYRNFVNLVVGGKKLHLCHSRKNYNTSLENQDYSEYDKIFEGHIHFEEEGELSDVVRATGIGGVSKTASYVIITETEDGYKKEIVTIPYNAKNTINSINESDLPIDQKDKIESWVGRR